MSGGTSSTDARTRILVVSDGLPGATVAALLQKLEECAELDVLAVSQAPVTLRAFDDFPAPIHMLREPKLKGRGRSELAQLRTRAMHQKARKP